MRFRSLCLIPTFALTCMLAASAQDTRTVTEPKIPSTCAKLEAHFSAVVDAATSEATIADESALDTDRIQKALDTCKPGKSVELALSKDGKNNSFLTAPLDMRSGVTLLIDKGITLYGSRDAKLYDMKEPGSEAVCGTMGGPTPPPVFPAPQRQARGGCRPLIGIVNATNVGLMGEGTIDGRGYAKILGKDYSWWQQARKAEPNNERYYNTRLIYANHADGLILYGIHLNNSANFHVSINQTNGFTAWGVHLKTPTRPGADARNTDGIDPGSSTNVTVAHSWIDNGDDNIAIKTGVTHMSVLDNHFYSGHGMSIGSETYTGQSYLYVDGLVEDHTTSGIRIKSNVTRGGPVHDLVYKNICMRGVKNPIAISPYYTNQTVEPYEDPKYKGDKIPDYKKIVLENIYSETAGDVLIAGLDDQHRTEVYVKNVLINGIQPSQVHLNYADISLSTSGADIPFAEVAKENKTVKLVSVPYNYYVAVRRGGDAEKALSKARMANPDLRKPGFCTDKFVPYR